MLTIFSQYTAKLLSVDPKFLMLKYWLNSLNKCIKTCICRNFLLSLLLEKTTFTPSFKSRHYVFTIRYSHSSNTLALPAVIVDCRKDNPFGNKACSVSC